MSRYANLKQILQLDPQRDHCKIYHIMTSYEFPWEMNRALELALLRTFCVPSISALLSSTGEFRYHSQKRYDDTSIIVAELARWGYDSDRGREVIRRMNRMHRRFAIANDDFLYVLSTVIYEPIRWNACFGWRRMCEQERLASFYFWREVGKRMGIREIPDSYEALEQFNRNYEQRHFRYAPSNQTIGLVTQNLLLSWFPAWLHPMLRSSLHALLDDSAREALGMTAPPTPMRWLVISSLKLRSIMMHLVPPRHQDASLTAPPHRSYPDGYQLNDLGPTALLPSLNRESTTQRVSRCPMRALWGRIGVGS
jgi:hypothetical protein